MQVNITKTVERNSFWLSLLIHLLLLLVWSLAFFPPSTPPQPKPKLEQTNSQEIPSYIYQEPKPVTETKAQQAQKDLPQSQNALEKGLTSTKPQMANEVKVNPSPARQAQRQLPRSSKMSQAVHLIGDQNIDNKLVKILGIAITQHLAYPKIAQDFDLRGMVGVGFTLSPDGSVTDVELVRSSSTDVLDEAALSAIKAISPVHDAGLYVNKPEHIVFGIIFD